MLTLICFSFFLFFASSLSHNCFFILSAAEIFLSLPLALLFLPHIAISLPEYYLLGRRQTDFGWVTPVRLIPSTPTVFSSPLSLSLCRCSSIVSLSLKGQRREWHLSTWTLSRTFPLRFLRPSLTWDKVTFTEGRHASLGAPALFDERPLNRVMEGEGLWRRPIEKVEKLKVVWWTAEGYKRDTCWGGGDKERGFERRAEKKKNHPATVAQVATQRQNKLTLTPSPSAQSVKPRSCTWLSFSPEA